MYKKIIYVKSINYRESWTGINFQYTTEFCPRNETEWLERSYLFNCTGEDNTYACFPNDAITELIEFCYPLQIIAIPPGKRKYELGFYFRSTVQCLLQKSKILSNQIHEIFIDLIKEYIKQVHKCLTLKIQWGVHVYENKKEIWV